MRVLVNALRPLRGGIAVYLDELVQGLSARADVELVVAAREGRAVSSLTEARTFDLWPTPWSILQERGVLRELCRDVRPDVLFSPIPLPPGASACPSVVTVHDLNFKFIPAGFWRSKYRHASFSAMARHATALIAISEHTRDALLEHYPHAGGKTRVIWNGFRAPDTLPPIQPLPPSGTQDPFLLTFAHWPHKNAHAAVKVLGRLVSDAPALRLNVVGASQRMRDRLLATATSERVEDRIDFVGSVSTEELYTLYQETTALLFISEYEGFGLPVFEALAMGCPVVVSDRGALPEISSGHACVVRVDGWDPAAEYVRRHWNDTAWSIDVRRRAREYVSRWTWARTVEETTEVLRAVCG